MGKKPRPKKHKPGTPEYYGLPPDPAAAGWKITRSKTFTVRAKFGGRQLGDLPHVKREALRCVIGDVSYNGMSSFATDYAKTVADPYDAEALYDQFVAATFDAGIIVDDRWDYERPPDDHTMRIFETPEGEHAFIRMLVNHGVPVIKR